ncbi:MAG: hypothetical protein WAN50_03155 [Minisyncoccia bacterium]
MEPNTKQNHPKFVRWALLVGIVVILNIFFNVVVALAYPAPVYNDFCKVQPAINPSDAATCDSQGGIWTEYPAVAPTPINGKAEPMIPTGSGYCDMTAKCQPLYQAASDRHSLYAFTIMVGLGILSVLAGFVPIGSSIVSAGLSYGGVVAFIVASTQYWSDAGNWMRLFISTVGLIILLYTGWRRFRD